MDYTELCRQTLLWAFIQEAAINISVDSIHYYSVQLQAVIKTSIWIVQLVCWSWCVWNKVQNSILALVLLWTKSLEKP
jgi:hypothetical protein